MTPTRNFQPDARSLLVVEDDDSVRDRLVEAFELDGYRVAGAASIEAARDLLVNGEHDLMLLDVNLPDGIGYDLLRDMRRGTLGSTRQSLSQLPVLMISGRAHEYDRIRGFECGCDDYVTKPYSFGELRGRVAAILRRRASNAFEEILDVGELQIDTRRRRVTLVGREITLTDKEYSLLVALAADPERVFERSRLLDEVWGYDRSSSTRTLDAHACRLRMKLSGGRRKYVENRWGVGYTLIGPGTGC